jgi:hypothetical protein
LADIKISKDEPTAAALLKCSKLGSHSKHTGIELNRIQWNGMGYKCVGNAGTHALCYWPFL